MLDPDSSLEGGAFTPNRTIGIAIINPKIRPTHPRQIPAWTISIRWMTTAISAAVLNSVCDQQPSRKASMLKPKWFFDKDGWSADYSGS